MPLMLGTPARQPGDDRADHRPRPVQLLIAILVFVAVAGAGNLIVNLQSRELEARNQVELLIEASAVRARLSRELNRVLYLTSGLSAYLAVRRDNLQRDEIEAILASLYENSSHIRNFAVAVGYRLTYVYPVRGNEKAVGLNYPDRPDQWPAVKRAVDSGQPLLIGPIKLVQGGSGLIYRVPIFIKDRYWGLLSSVINAESLITEGLLDGISGGYSLAIRNIDEHGNPGPVFWGRESLFGERNAQRVAMEVPGGQWELALHAGSVQGQQNLWLMRGLVWLLALTLGWGALIVMMQRSRLAHQAMFDPLTRLPNRLLTSDRINRSLSGLRRDASRSCLLLFIDLDGFKLINDCFGHKAGDFALQSAAARMAKALRESDTVGRWGGDEFVVFMENVDTASIDELTGKIRDLVEQPVQYAGNQLTVGASIGHAWAPADGTLLDELIRTADQRMYANKDLRSKHGGR